MLFERKKKDKKDTRYFLGLLFLPPLFFPPDPEVVFVKADGKVNNIHYIKNGDKQIQS